MDTPFRTSAEVTSALSEGRPVVALETAVLTHGLPRGENLEAFREMEVAIAQAGAVPAAVALLDGVLRVGLSEGESERLGADGAVSKVILPDLPLLVSRGASGGTTVAVTLWAAQKAGIPVFATGGLGGVHRGACDTFDLSGDVAALARYSGCVVCSGAKVILDLAKTFEVLETLGVAVLGYGVDELPAFTCRESGIPARQRVDTPEQVAAVVRARDRLGLSSSVIVALPPPVETALSRSTLDGALDTALREAQEAGIRGKALTPFLLDAVAKATGGASVRANRALLVSNARLAADVAVALAACR